MESRTHDRAVVRDRDRIEVEGRIRWAHTGAPVEQAEISIYMTGTQTCLGTATTNGKGDFDLDLAVCEDGGGLEVYAVVRDAKGTALLSTSESPVRILGERLHWDLMVDGRIDPKNIRLRPTIKLGNIEADALSVAEAKPEIALDIARAFLKHELPGEVRKRIARISPQFLPEHGAEKTLCGTSTLMALEALIRHKGWPEELRYSIYDTLGGTGAGFTEHVYDSANFEIHYYVDGTAAVDTDTSAQDVIDPGTTTVLASLPAGDPPTYIKRVAFWLERALSKYVSPPFNLRNPASGGRIPAHINTSAFGSATPSAFYLNNALSNDMIAAVTVHELFHMVQYQYSGVWGGAGDWVYSMTEGGAVWAEDTNTQMLNRYLDEAGTNFNGTGVQVQPDQSLVSAGYKCSLLWRYISEQQSGIPTTLDEPIPLPTDDIGVDVYKPLIESCSGGSFSTADLKTAIRNLPWYQDFYEFGFLDAGRLDRTSSETLYGNYVLACYLQAMDGAGDRRFDLMEKDETIYIDEALASMGVVDPPQPGDKIAPVTLTASSTLTAAGSLTYSNSLSRFASRYYEIAVDAAVDNVQVQFNAAGMTAGLFQIALIDEDMNLRNVYRSDAGSFTKQFANVIAGKRLLKVVLVASGTDVARSFTIGVNAVGAASNVMVTRWHSRVGNEYEIDSRNWSWTWISPDIWVDNNGDGLADGDVYFNENNKLFIRLHNQGNADASGISVAFYYQDASGGLSAGAWLPVVDTGSTTQSLSGLSLAAGTSNQWNVNWSPSPSGSSHHFCIRAIVTVPGDPNTDNKRVLSNFGNVHVHAGGFGHLVLVRRNLFDVVKNVRLAIVPHLPPELRVATPDLTSKADLRMAPGEMVYDSIRVEHRPRAAKPVKPVKEQIKEDNACRAISVQTAPDPTGFYPLDDKALPPGLAGKPMITLAHMVDGIPIGGMTFMLTVDGKGKS